MSRHRRREQKTEKKERVIHTRVSEDLESELKKRAGDLGVSVSNLVRNVLHNAIDMVEDIVEDSARVAASARGSRGGAAEPAPVSEVAPALLGWQQLILELNAVCDRCNEILPRGTRGAVAVYDRPGPRKFLCSICTEELTRHEPPQSDPA